MSEQAKTLENQPLPTTSGMLFENLQSLDIAYNLHNHKPIFTVEEGEPLKKDIPGLHCRNLFLRDKKKKMFLVVAANETEIDLKSLQNLLGCGRLSFGSADRLWQYLGIRPGSVCPFCIMNDKDREVSIILDHSMMEAERVNYHPLDNAMTIGLPPSDLLKFIKNVGHEPHIIDLST
ncbi:MAG: prolyl-tRNA editing protein [Micavibrio sp.]|nr:MAG: prolyl-tRNA editing protein [Micavibrio sp.]